MGRTYDDWIKTQDQALVAKTRAGDESNKPLLNQINWIWVANLVAKKPELNPLQLNYLIGLHLVKSKQCENNT